MTSDQKIRMRHKSMLGTVLFALGILAAIVSLATGAVWLAGASAVLLVPGVALLCQVGKSLS